MEEQKKYLKYQKISIVLFCIFILAILLIINQFFKIYIIKDLFAISFIFFLTIFYIPIYFIYITILTFYIYFKYSKIFNLNSIVFLIFVITLMLHCTGFCFKEMRYLSKGELIDIKLQSSINSNCDAEYKAKYDINMEINQPIDAKKECSISFESIKMEAPQCFTDNRADVCIGTVTHFDTKMQSVVKKEIEVYRYYGREYNYNIMRVVSFSIISALGVSRSGEPPMRISSCGCQDYYHNF
jgi:hypothetical protein